MDFDKKSDEEATPGRDNSTSGPPTVMDLLTRYKRWVMVGVAVVVIGFLLLARVSVSNSGNTKQADLPPLYNDTTLVLSKCVRTTTLAIGAAKANAASLNTVISNAVQGRYAAEELQTANSQSPLFKAIAEAYPDTKGISDLFSKALDKILTCQGEFTDSQQILQRQVASFEKFRTGSAFRKVFGSKRFPTSDMEITYKGGPISGKAAYKQMKQLIVVGEAQDARDTGEQQNNDDFGNGATTP